MARGNFTASINRWVAETKERQTVVFQNSAEAVLEEVVRPGPSVARPGASGGGNMPISTGFLASSLQVVVGDGIATLVPNPISNSEGKQVFQYDAAATSLVIQNAKIGDTLTATFAAEYAIIMEARYAFVRLAAQRWPQIVEAEAAKAQAAVESQG